MSKFSFHNNAIILKPYNNHMVFHDVNKLNVAKSTLPNKSSFLLTQTKSTKQFRATQHFAICSTGSAHSINHPARFWRDFVRRPASGFRVISFRPVFPSIYVYVYVYIHTMYMPANFRRSAPCAILIAPFSCYRAWLGGRAKSIAEIFATHYAARC